MCLKIDQSMSWNQDSDWLDMNDSSSLLQAISLRNVNFKVKSHHSSLLTHSSLSTFFQISWLDLDLNAAWRRRLSIVLIKLPIRSWRMITVLCLLSFRSTRSTADYGHWPGELRSGASRMTAEGQLIIIEFDINWIWIVFIHKEHLASFISSYVYDIYFRKASNWWGFDVRLIWADKRVCSEMSEITALAIVPQKVSCSKANF